MLEQLIYAYAMQGFVWDLLCLFAQDPTLPISLPTLWFGPLLLKYTFVLLRLIIKQDINTKVHSLKNEPRQQVTTLKFPN